MKTGISDQRLNGINRADAGQMDRLLVGIIIKKEPAGFPLDVYSPQRAKTAMPYAMRSKLYASHRRTR